MSDEIEHAKAQLDWIMRGNGKKYEDPEVLQDRIRRLQAIIRGRNT